MQQNKQDLAEKIQMNPLLMLSPSERIAILESGEMRECKKTLQEDVLAYCFPELWNINGLESFNADVFMSAFDSSLRSWSNIPEEGKQVKIFPKYFESLYDKKAGGIAGKEILQGQGRISEYNYRISRDVIKLMNMGISDTDAIEELKTTKYTRVRETTWKIIRKIVAEMYRTDSYDEYPDDEDHGYETIGEESEEIENLFNNKNNLDTFMDAVWYLIDPKINKIKKRTQMRDCCTFFMLKPLKLKDTKGNVPYEEKPACDLEMFEAYRTYENQLMHDVFSAALIEMAIEPYEESLDSLWGVAHNFLKEGITLRKNELQKYWNFNNPSQVSRAVSEFKEPLIKAFSDYLNRD